MGIQEQPLTPTFSVVDFLSETEEVDDARAVVVEIRHLGVPVPWTLVPVFVSDDPQGHGVSTTATLDQDGAALPSQFLTDAAGQFTVTVHRVEPGTSRVVVVLPSGALKSTGLTFE